MSEISSGTLLAGKYRIESLLGRGGMGSVWRAEHLGLNAPVAVKLLDLVHFGAAEDAFHRFHREARAAATIRSPHVVQIFDHGVDPSFGVPFIVMELMEGETLAERIARTGCIAPADTGRYLTHVARALTRAHEAGIVHRDLKPDNVFLVRNEDRDIAKVLDFGVAKASLHGVGKHSATGTVVGTAYYMSPEQISGARDVDFRTDLWAFGVMASECLTGRRPFDADTIGGMTLKICVEPIPVPSSFGPVPSGFDAWFARIVNRVPSQRFSSAREAADALRSLCTEETGAVSLTPSLAPPAVHAPTATIGPLSRSSLRLVTETASAKGSVATWLVGGTLVVALAGGLWLSRASELRTTAAGASKSSASTIRTIAEPAPSGTASASSSATPTASLTAPSAAPVPTSAPPLQLKKSAGSSALAKPVAATAAATVPAHITAAEAPKPTLPPRDLLDSR